MSRKNMSDSPVVKGAFFMERGKTVLSICRLYTIVGVIVPAKSSFGMIMTKVLRPVLARHGS